MNETSAKYRKLRAEFDLTLSDFFVPFGKKDRQAFEQFSAARISFESNRMIVVIVVFCSVYVYSMALVHAQSRIFIAIIAGASLFVRNPAVLYAYWKANVIHSNSDSSFRLSRSANVWSLFSSCLSGLFLIARVVNGTCDEVDQIHMYGCNPERQSHALPQELMLVIMILPIATAIIFKSVGLRFIVLSWLTGIISMLIAIIISNAFMSFPSVIVYIPLSLVMLYEIHRQDMVLYRISEKFLEEAVEKSGELKNDLRFMIDSIAHDFKTPLNALVNGVEELSIFNDKLCPASQEAQAHQTSVKTIIRNLSNVNTFMTASINRCLDYTKSSRGIKLVPMLETIHLQQAISLAISCVRDLQSRIVVVQKTIPIALSSHIVTDAQWLQENILALVSNAVKYSFEGLVTVSVDLVASTHPYFSIPGVERAAGIVPTNKRSSKVYIETETEVISQDMFLLFEVVDTGIGVPASWNPFEPFNQHSRHSTGGLGLGLYCLYQRMTALGGMCGNRNREDGTHGSIFWFAIPYRPDIPGIEFGTHSARGSTTGSVDHSIASSYSRSSNFSVKKIRTTQLHLQSPLSPQSQYGERKKLRILMVDDSLTILKMTGNLLKRRGHEFETAENGADGLERLRASLPFGPGRPFDLVLMDLNMPVMDGLEAIKKLREEERERNDGSHQKIIVVTANSDNETREEAINVGADYFMSKPFSVNGFESICEILFPIEVGVDGKLAEPIDLFKVDSIN